MRGLARGLARGLTLAQAQTLDAHTYPKGVCKFIYFIRSNKYTKQAEETHKEQNADGKSAASK